MPPVQQLGDHAAHRVAHGDEPADAEDLRQRRDVVGAVLEPEPPAGADPVAVAAQVHGDDAEMGGERGEDLSPVEFGREGDPVDEHERLGAAGAGAFPDPRDPAAGQLHQARTRGRDHPCYLPHGLTPCDASRQEPGRRSITASGPCVPDARSATRPKARIPYGSTRADGEYARGLTRVAAALRRPVEAGPVYAGVRPVIT